MFLRIQAAMRFCLSRCFVVKAKTWRFWPNFDWESSVANPEEPGLCTTTTVTPIYKALMTHVFPTQIFLRPNISLMQDFRSVEKSGEHQLIWRISPFLPRVSFMITKWSLVGWIWEPSTILHSKTCFIIFPFPQKNWLPRTYKWLAQHPETTAWISSTSPKKAGWNLKTLQLTPRESQRSSSWCIMAFSFRNCQT